MKLINILDLLEEKYPLFLAEEWDNVGLLVGDPEKEIKNICICLDITLEILQEAQKKNVDLIISHHPLIFHSIKKINTQTVLGKKLQIILSSNMAIYALHTNIDIASDGLNDYILKKINFLGEIYQLEEQSPIRIQELSQAYEINTIIEKIKSNLGIVDIRYVGDKNKAIKKVAIVTGSGSSYIPLLPKDVDLFITSDITYHTALDAFENGLSLLDIGHYGSEYLFVELLFDFLSKSGISHIIPFYGKPVFNI